jgi:hypothetical protein
MSDSLLCGSSVLVDSCLLSPPSATCFNVDAASWRFWIAARPFSRGFSGRLEPPEERRGCGGGGQGAERAHEVGATGEGENRRIRLHEHHRLHTLFASAHSTCVPEKRTSAAMQIRIEPRCDGECRTCGRWARSRSSLVALRCSCPLVACNLLEQRWISIRSDGEPLSTVSWRRRTSAAPAFLRACACLTCLSPLILVAVGGWWRSWSAGSLEPAIVLTRPRSHDRSRRAHLQRSDGEATPQHQHEQKMTHQWKKWSGQRAVAPRARLLARIRSPRLAVLSLSRSRTPRRFPPSLAQMKKIAVKFDAWDPQAKGVKSVACCTQQIARLALNGTRADKERRRGRFACCSCRSFLFQVSNNRLHKSNPKCVVEQILVSDKTPPTVEFTFKNDRQSSKQCGRRTMRVR